MMRKSASNILLLFSVFSLSICTYAQNNIFRSDIEHIHVQLSQINTDQNKRPYIYSNERSFIKKFNPLGLVLGGSLYFYQNVLSKHFSADCLYNPSCSDFSKQAIKEYGFLKGTLLTIDRLNRCNRIAAQDLKRYPLDPLTNRYPDPVSRYRKPATKNGE